MKWKISVLTIFLIVMTIGTLYGVIYNNSVTKNTHNTADEIYEMISDGSEDLIDTYDAIKNIELNQKNNTSISQNRFIMCLIFTIFSFKFDKLKHMQE